VTFVGENEIDPSPEGDSFARRHTSSGDGTAERRGLVGEPRVPPRQAGRLNPPRPALVETGVDGAPRLVNREVVVLVREEWRVVDRWWTDEPVDRRYFEVVLESGRNTAVYRDGEAASWFTQRA
jgi:hypothetical protein